MMRCETVKELLEAYVEGELDESKRKAVEAHIADCRSCKQELALTQRIPLLIGSLATPPVPKDIIPNTLERLHGTRTAQWGWLRSFGAFLSRRWQLAALACVLLVISLFGISYQRMNRGPEIAEAEVAAAVEDAKFALGIVGAATQKAEFAILTEGARVLDIARSGSEDTIQTLSRAQLEVYEKLRRNLAVLSRL